MICLGLKSVVFLAKLQMSTTKLLSLPLINLNWDLKCDHEDINSLSSLWQLTVYLFIFFARLSVLWHLIDSYRNFISTQRLVQVSALCDDGLK